MNIISWVYELILDHKQSMGGNDCEFYILQVQVYMHMKVHVHTI